jgi:hypothetical protein
MKHKLLAAAAVIAALASGPRAQAGVVTFKFGGAGVGGSGLLTFAPDMVVGDPSGAYTITNISGTFSDSNIGLSNEAITGLVPINPVSPPHGAPFPVSLSLFSVSNPPPGDTAISYDNLFYPDGSPITCSDYKGFGGYLDVYGVLFTLKNGDFVDLWSNGEIPGGAPLDYGVIVVDGSYTVVDSQFGGVSMAVPEPGSRWLLVTGLLGALAWRRGSAASRARVALGG